MLTRALRLLTVAVALVALAVPAAAVAGPRGSVDRGIVQSADSGQIVLRTLDGGIVSYSVVRRTAVRVNGSRATITDVQPGFVARVVHDARARALAVEAFGATATTTERGVVTAISKNAITLRVAGGGSLTFSLDSSTQFKFHGARAPRRVARPGAQVAVVHATDASATVVNVVKRAGA